MYSVYITEDEPLALESLVAMFKPFKQWQVVGTADNGGQALQDCLDNPPDLLVTDIKMPILDGLEVVAELQKSQQLPQTVFITAYDQHALEAFRLAAVDYLLKPITDSDFKRTLRRVEKLLENQKASQHLQSLNSELDELLKNSINYLKTLVIRSIGRIDFVPISEVVAFCSSGNYIDVITTDKEYLHRQTLKSLSAEINPEQFIRIHRSTIVAISHIRMIKRQNSTDVVVLSNGRELTVGAKYQQQLRNTS